MSQSSAEKNSLPEISHCNSAAMVKDPSDHSEMYLEFKQFVENTNEPLQFSEKDILLMRMVLTLSEHVKENLNIRVLCTEQTNRFMVIHQFATKYWPYLDDKFAHVDIILDTIGELLELETLKQGGWLIAPAEASREYQAVQFVSDFEFQGWRFRCRAIEPKDFQGHIYAIVPVHNRCQLTLDFVARFKSQTIASKIELIIVDDGSTDGLAQQLEARHQDVTLLEGDGNLWWGGAINLGLEHIRRRLKTEDFVAFVNNDAILEPTTFENLLRHALKDRAVCLAPMTFSNGDANAPGEAGYALYRFEQAERLFSRNNRMINVEHLFGRCSLFTAEALQHLGGIDEHLFPHYWGDSDFFLRARSFGYHSMVTGDVNINVYHGEDTSGSHHNFFLKKRSFRRTWAYLTEKRSLGALIYGWRFYSRHNRSRRWEFLIKTIYRAMKNLNWFSSTQSTD